MRPPISQYDYRDPDLQRHGCTIAATSWLAREATDGDLPRDDVDALAARLRDLSGVSLATFRDRGTTLDEAERAYEALTLPNRGAFQMRRIRGGSVRDLIIPALGDRTWALVAVNYGAVQAAGKGVGSFRGGHAVVVGKPTAKAVTVADPLRRELVTWPIDLLVRAMETFGSRPWGDGRGEAGIVSHNPTILELRTAERDAALAEVTRLTGVVENRDRRIAALSIAEGAAKDQYRNEVAAHSLTRRQLDDAERDLAQAREQVTAERHAHALTQRTGEELRTALTAAGKRIAELEARPDCGTLAIELAGALERATQEQQRANAAEAGLVSLEDRVRRAVGVLTL